MRARRVLLTNKRSFVPRRLGITIYLYVHNNLTVEKHEFAVFPKRPARMFSVTVCVHVIIWIHTVARWRSLRCSPFTLARKSMRFRVYIVNGRTGTVRFKCICNGPGQTIFRGSLEESFWNQGRDWYFSKITSSTKIVYIFLPVFAKWFIFTL